MFVAGGGRGSVGPVGSGRLGAAAQRVEKRHFVSTLARLPLRTKRAKV
jgi:hypothetical protein